jgi:hypothetical protein
MEDIIDLIEESNVPEERRNILAYKGYEIGGLISGGMIGCTYIARFNNRKDFPTTCAIK